MMMALLKSRISALVVFAAAATLFLISNHEYIMISPALRKQRRKLSLLDFSDPKSVSNREKFPYAISSEEKNCINPQEVMELANLIRDLYEQHGIRVFPRNGFLLGIIRHGGFLPNEDTPDADLGIISTDVDRVRDEAVAGENLKRPNVGEFRLHLKPSEENWVSWKGTDPANGEKYPFLAVRVIKPLAPSTFLRYGVRANAVYPYKHQPGTFFFPRLNIKGYNHIAHTEEMLRYNSEGANFRLLDTNELLSEENNEDGLQIGTVFNTNFECMVLRQFYFTEIYVPCAYESILTAFYGEHWNHVEDRKQGGKGKFAAKKLNDRQNLKRLQSGPKPLCSSPPDTS